MKFTKMQGAGNDFVVIESKHHLDWSKMAMKIATVIMASALTAY